ncbi:MAG: hypothetical protein JWN20_2657 [Jatrophihabitantaceae bacterium]|nr:hypothetical protein [Jatrophihabitantaceae bacterium]
MRVNRKIAAGVAAGLMVAAGAGTAFAYWTTSGSGTGSATTSVGAASLVVAQTSTISNMYPGDSAQTISGTVKNTAVNSAYVTQVVVSIASVTGGLGACDATDYTLASPTMLIGTDVASGVTVNFAGATLKFNNKATNQDGCKGATVNLAYAAS